MANLIEIWNQAPSGDEITLYSEHDEPIAKVTKRGSFAGVVRQLAEMVPEKDMLSDRWRWRIRG